MEIYNYNQNLKLKLEIFIYNNLRQKFEIKYNNNKEGLNKKYRKINTITKK
jgi:hypothetical protein